MKFVQKVRGKEIAWPTQSKFDINIWIKEAKQSCEDETDERLANTGIIVAKVLNDLRKIIDSLSPGQFSHTELIGLCNRDFFIIDDISNQAQSLPNLLKSEALLKSLQQPILGSGKIGDLIDSAIDSINRVLNFSYPKKNSKNTTQARLANLIKLVNYATAYQTVEDCFHRSLWLDWYIIENGDGWYVSPSNLKNEKYWEASWRRYEENKNISQAQFIELWQKNSAVRILWAMQTKGVPQFELKCNKEICHINYLRHQGFPDELPDSLFYEIQSQSFYSVLLTEPLPDLGGKTIRDLLYFLLVIREMAICIKKQFPSNTELKNIENLDSFCPVVSLKSLTDSLINATGFGKKDIDVFLNNLTWANSKNLWFHPLVKSPSPPGYFFVMTPILYLHTERVINYWLANFQLPIGNRGAWFEKYIEEKLNLMQNSPTEIKIIGSRKFQIFNEIPPEEEIDLLIFLNGSIILGEAKCQFLPETIMHNFNYLDTLTLASEQAKRKARWVKNNIEFIAKSLGVDLQNFSGEVIPIVITEPSIGVGLIIDDVPVLDLLLLRNYFTQPYRASGYLTKEGIKISKSKNQFYNGPDEMASKFLEYANNPFFLHPYINSLEEKWQVYFEFEGKPFKILQYLMNKDKLEEYIIPH